MLLVLAALLVFVAGVYSPAAELGFVDWDDGIYVTGNPLIRDLSLPGLWTILSTSYYNGYTPVTMLSLAADYAWWGSDPRGYHLTNVALHLANTALVFTIAGLVSRRTGVRAACALLFAVHPLRVESVAWISERKDVLYAFFYLASYQLYLRYVRADRRPAWWLGGSLALFACSALSKHAAVTLPLVLVVTDYYLGRRFSRSVIAEKAAYGTIAALTLVAAWMLGAAHDNPYAFVDRLLFGGYSVVFYLRTFVAPVGLTAVYPYPDQENGWLPMGYYAAAGLTVAGLLALGWALVRFPRVRREIVLGAGFFFANIVIVTHVVASLMGRVIVADRYSYIPHIGLVLLVGVAGERLLARATAARRAVVLALVLAVVAWHSAATRERIGVWRNTMTLFTDVLEENPESALAHVNVGAVHAREGRHAQALHHYDIAIDEEPKCSAAYNNKGMSQYALGDYRAAIREYSAAIALDPGFGLAYENRGRAKYQIGDIAGAWDDYTRALRLREAAAGRIHIDVPFDAC